MSDRLVIGTAQLGLAYGVANLEGQVSIAAGRAILDTALAAGIRQLDTAVAYGDSEARLGRIGVNGWEIVTKLPAAPSDVDDVRSWVVATTRESLARLGVPHAKAVLLHRPMELLGPKGADIAAGLRDLKEFGLAAKIGVSIYDPEELDQLPPSLLDLVQAPFNIVDRRLERTGWLDRLKLAGAEVHVRSAFLQGVLLMAEPNRPAWFGRWSSLWSTWHAWLAENDVAAIDACLAFLMARPQVDGIVVGVETAQQLNGIIAAACARVAEPPPKLATTDPDLVNPSRWRL